jgi:hypothetical protein
VTDAASSWLAFLASPVARSAITLPELDGYPTAVIVAPSMIRSDALHSDASIGSHGKPLSKTTRPAWPTSDEALLHLVPAANAA